MSPADMSPADSAVGTRKISGRLIGGSSVVRLQSNRQSRRYALTDCRAAVMVALPRTASPS
jgi:hypothetical protein